MAARNRLPPWHEIVRVADGRELLIRPIRPDDAVPLRAGFALMEPGGLHHRFGDPTPGTPASLSEQAAERLTHPDPRREFAIVASEPLPAGEALIGALARVSVVDDTRQGEFAILVGRYIAGMGLGRHLMRRLVRWSRGKQLDCLYGDVAEDNQPMLALAQSLGFRREDAVPAPGFVRVVLDLK
jgi:RimJ/RimL family protein N-acetyltransferase